MRKKTGELCALRYWQKGILPKGQRKLAQYADEIIQGIILDQGGQENITATQGVLLGQLRKCLIFQMIVDRWMARPGRVLIDAAGNLPPVLSAFYLAIMNNSVRFAREIGWKRVSPIGTLEKYLEAKSRAAAAAEPGESLTKDTGTAENVAPEGNGEGEL